MLAAITPSSSRDGDRHGEDVVHQQCTRDGESGLLAEVLGCHLVVPAARRVGVDVLAVRGDDHPEHHHHREGDPRRDRDGRETANASVRRISSGAYATDESASEANTGSAMRFGSRV